MKIGTKELKIPLIQGGMGVGVSLGNLAGHVARCGGIGVISSVNAGYAEPDFETDPHAANLRVLKREIEKAKEIAAGKGLVGVNVMYAVTNYAETCRCAARFGADVIISGAGLPLHLPELVEGTDALFAPIISSGRAARILLRHYERQYHKKPDFFVLEGYMAGGHLGFSGEELSSGTCKDNSVLLGEVKEAAGDIPVFVAGGVFDGKDMAKLIKEGAAGVQIGTRFIATTECDADPAFKKAIVKAGEEDIEIIESPVGMPARAIVTPLIHRLRRGERYPAVRCNNCLRTCKKKETPYCISRALIEAVKGNMEDGLFFAGENAARVDKILSVKELIDEIIEEYREHIK